MEDAGVRAAVSRAVEACKATLEWQRDDEKVREKQCEMWGLEAGSLRHALPVMRHEGEFETPLKYFGLFLPRFGKPGAAGAAGGLSDFFAEQAIVTGQLRQAALVAQASGSGKTKSAYDLALKGEFTAVVSTVKSAATPLQGAWGPAVDALSRMATAAGKKGAKVDGETPMLVAMGVYLEWASLACVPFPRRTRGRPRKTSGWSVTRRWRSWLQPSTAMPLRGWPRWRSCGSNRTRMGC